MIRFREWETRDGEENNGQNIKYEKKNEKYFSKLKKGIKIKIKTNQER